MSLQGQKPNITKEVLDKVKAHLDKLGTDQLPEVYVKFMLKETVFSTYLRDVIDARVLQLEAKVNDDKINMHEEMSKEFFYLAIFGYLVSDELRDVESNSFLKTLF